MEELLTFFPLSTMVHAGDIKALVISVGIYLVVAGGMGLLDKFLRWLPLVGRLLHLVFSLVGIYCVAGVVLAIWQFVQTV